MALESTGRVVSVSDGDSLTLMGCQLSVVETFGTNECVF